MKIIFKKTSGIIKNLNAFKWIDKDNRQLDEYEGKPSVPFPCALIKVSLPKCESIGGGRQMCTAQITVRLGFNLVRSETSTKAPDEALEKSLKYLDDVEAVYIALQGYTDSEVEIYDRVTQTEEERQDGLTVVKMIFTTSFIDMSAAR
jgi:hypothetical protein